MECPSHPLHKQAPHSGKKKEAMNQQHSVEASLERDGGGASTKEGYLLQMNTKKKGRVKKKWRRSWYVLRDGFFYSQEGKVVPAAQ